jgi:hypothetical protein
MYIFHHKVIFAAKITLQDFYCIAAEKAPIQASATALSFLGSLVLQSFASAMHATKVCLVEASSDLKITLFLRFQSCQQHSAMNVLKCLEGTEGGLLMQ